MSGYPPPGPPYWSPPYPAPPPGTYPPAPPPGPIPDYSTGPPAYWYPGTIMMPYPVAPMPQPQPLPSENQATYITNYIYHGEPPSTNETTSGVHVVESSGDFEWVPSTSTTAHMLQGRAVVGGHEGWDGSPLWVIRAWHNGDMIPGKLSIRHYSATVMYDGKEIPVQNIEVLCTPTETLRWVPASNGMVPPGAIEGGKTATGEVLYIGRAKYQLSLTPGKVHPSHRACYIGFAGREVAQKIYEVLCRLS